jgi:hypothetical protein
VTDPDCAAVASAPPTNSTCSGDGTSPVCCTRFTAAGSCVPNATVFPVSALKETDNSKCIDVPNAWTCDWASYGDSFCDCGCGIIDVDCQGENALSACDNSSAFGACSEHDANGAAVLDPAHNWQCVKTVPSGWTCSLESYDDAQNICDCGCGVADPDCTSSAATACDTCNNSGACASYKSVGDCSIISASNNARCIAGEWTCDPVAEGDGTCDCGCGKADPDCESASVTACAYCGDPGSCARNCAGITALDNSTCPVW